MKETDRLTCKETLRQLDDYLDSELDEHQMAMVRSHLKECDMCGSESAFEVSVFTCIKEKIQSLPLPDGLKDRVFGRIDELRRENS